MIAGGHAVNITVHVQNNRSMQYCIANVCYKYMYLYVSLQKFYMYMHIYSLKGYGSVKVAFSHVES